MDLPAQSAKDVLLFQNSPGGIAIELPEVCISSENGFRSLSAMATTTTTILNAVNGNSIVGMPLRKTFNSLNNSGVPAEPSVFNVPGKKFIVLLSTKKTDFSSVKMNSIENGKASTSSDGKCMNKSEDSNSSSKISRAVVINPAANSSPGNANAQATKKSKGHRCYFCGQKFFDKKVLKKHIVSHKDRPYICDICDKAFTDKSVLRKHKFSHSGERSFMCESCGKTYVYNWDLQKHIQSAHSGIEQRCETCFKKMRSRCDSQCWQCVNEGKKVTSDGKYVCTVCNLFFNSLPLLDEHFLVHKLKSRGGETLLADSLDKGGLFTCNTCGRVCKSSTTLKSHLLSHSEERPFSCDQCSSRFKSLDGLKHHMASHVQEKPYVCPTCHSSFKSSHRLKQHLLNHTEVRPFSCDICKSTFKSSCVLKKHLITHSSDKPFPCSTCGSRFKSMYSLKQHLIVHSSERPYVCSMCNKSYKFLSNHLRHQRTHTGESPYECIICNKRFNQANSLRLHMVVHSKDNF